MPFRNDFFSIFMDFGRENGAKLAPKSCQKSMLTSNSRFSRKPTKTNRILMFFLKFVTQVKSQNALKIDSKIYSKIKCVLASIFLDFGRQVGVEMAPKIKKTMQIQMRLGSILSESKRVLGVLTRQQRTEPGR